MPELPEVETIRRCLEEEVLGKTIKEVWIKKGSRLLRDTVGPAAMKKGLTGEKIEALGRRGKYLILALSGGGFLVVHLGMTGAFYTLAAAEKEPKHTHLLLRLGANKLILKDPRTFGRVFLVAPGALGGLAPIAALGPEPLDPGFSSKELLQAFARRRTPLKAALLDQSVVAGLGNIYADESSFRAGLHPLRPASQITAAEAGKLVKSIRAALTQSIALQGCTISDYEWAKGKEGGFAAMLRVYGRKGEPCRKCGTAIERIVVGGRSTFFCPKCQK